MKALLLAGAGALALLSAGPAQAAPITYSATLFGAAENPPINSPGAGVAYVTIDTDANFYRVDVTWSGLVGLTTVAHVHCCVDPPGNVGVATPTPSFPGFPVGVTSGSYSRTFDTTLASSWNAAFVTANGGTLAGAEAALAAGLAAGRAYFNLHSQFAPGGEIRGFLGVPEPATIGLLGVGLAGLAMLRRRRAA
jgi:hypothetical protein